MMGKITEEYVDHCNKWIRIHPKRIKANKAIVSAMTAYLKRSAFSGPVVFIQTKRDKLSKVQKQRPNIELSSLLF
jgi:hypothetical protein